MDETLKNQVDLSEEYGDEYMMVPVPMEKRRSLWKQIWVWVGFGYAVTGLLVGGSLAGSGGVGMPFGPAMWSVVIGMGLLFILTSMLGVITMTTGMNLALVTRYSYGSKGFIIPAGVMFILTLAWFGQLTGMVGDFWALMLGNPTGVIVFTPANIGFPHVDPITLEFFIVCIAWGAIFTITAARGVGAIEKVATWLTPALALSGFIALFAWLSEMGGFGAVAESARDISGLGFGHAVTIVVGSWIVGCYMGTELFRFNKNVRDVVLCAGACFIVTNPMLMVVGYLGWIHLAEPNYMSVMLGMGVVFAFIAVLLWTISLWTTNNAELYCNALYTGPTLKNIFGRYVSRKTLVIVAGIIGTVIAALAFFQLFFHAFVGILGAIAPPVVAPLLADFYIIRGKKPEKYSDKVLNEQPGVRWAGIVSGLGGMFFGFIFQYVAPLPWGLPSGVAALILGIIIYVIVYQFAPDSANDDRLVEKAKSS